MKRLLGFALLMLIGTTSFAQKELSLTEQDEVQLREYIVEQLKADIGEMCDPEELHVTASDEELTADLATWKGKKKRRRQPPRRSRIPDHIKERLDCLIRPYPYCWGGGYGARRP